MLKELLKQNNEVLHDLRDIGIAIFRYFGIEPVAMWRGIVWDCTFRPWALNGNSLSFEDGREYVHEVRYEGDYALAYFDNAFLLDVRKRVKNSFQPEGLRVEDGDLLKKEPPFRYSAGFVMLPSGDIIGFRRDED